MGHVTGHLGPSNGGGVKDIKPEKVGRNLLEEGGFCKRMTSTGKVEAMPCARA